MSVKTAEQMAEETRKTRIEMRALTKMQGLTENEALAKVLPSDRNRTKKLKRWKEKGLWPVPESEIAECAAPSNPNSDIQRISPKDSDSELLERIRAILDTIELAERPVGKTGKNRFSPLKTKMIAIRIPESLDDELKALGDLKSRHIEKAIMLYLKAMKAGESEYDQS